MEKKKRRPKLKMHEMELLQSRLERTFHSEYISNPTKGQGLPSVNELAEVYNVSPAVTRKFYKRLQDDGVIRTERRKGCYLVAPGLFKFIYQRKERLIGIIGYTDENHLGTPAAPTAIIIQAVERAAAAHGWLIRFYNTYPERCFNDEILLTMAKDGVDAVFLLSSENQEQDIKRLQTLDIPILIRDREMPGATCVAFDNHQIGVLATTYLLNRGHRNIAYIEPSPNHHTDWSDARKQSCIETVRRSNPDFNVPGVMQVDFEDPASVVAVVSELNESDFTAVFCGNDHIAAALILGGLNRAKLAVVGVDNDFKYTSLHFSSIEVSAGILGESAFKALVEHFDHEKELPSLVLHNGILIRRESNTIMNNGASHRAAGF